MAPHEVDAAWLVVVFGAAGAAGEVVDGDSVGVEGVELVAEGGVGVAISDIETLTEGGTVDVLSFGASVGLHPVNISAATIQGQARSLDIASPS